MLKVNTITKRYGEKTAVDALSFTVPDGQVTGFLGPNGSGKTTTMRMCVGLENPTSGQALFDAHPFRSLRNPARVVGCLLDPTWFQPGHTARAHLGFIAAAIGAPPSRVNEVLDEVGLGDVAGKRIGGFSLGMKQRLGLASALVGDPKHVLFDEPVNGLDPEGVHWMRQKIRSLAAEGRAVLVSSHLLSEMAVTADRLVVIGKGALIKEGPVSEFINDAGASYVEVRTPDQQRLHTLLSERGIAVDVSDELLRVYGARAEDIGKLCFVEEIPIFSLVETKPTLEQAFLAATSGAVEYRATDLKEQSCLA